MVDEERRAAVLAEVVSNLGPSDGTVVSTPLTGPSTLKLTEDVVGAITSRPDHISSFCLVFYVLWTQIHYIRIGIRIQKFCLIGSGYRFDPFYTVPSSFEKNLVKIIFKNKLFKTKLFESVPFRKTDPDPQSC